MATINGTILPDIIVGTSEDDTINGFAGLDTLSGGEGNDVIDGGDGDDILFGNDGNDILIGGPGSATLLSVYNGGQGNDLMIATDLGVAEDFDGEDGIDTVSFAARDLGVTTFLSVLGIPLLDTLRNVENVIGSAFDDTLTGDGGNNTLDGAAGDDVLAGGDGADVLIGGTGADEMFGGTNDDVYYIDNAGDTVTEAGSSGNDTVRSSISVTLAAGASIEHLETADASATTAIGLTGNELGQSLSGNAGDNLLDGSGGSDTAVFTGVRADYTIVDNGDGTVTVTDTRAGVNDGSDTIVNIESVQFADGTFTLTVLLNTAPVAIDDALAATEDTPATYTAAEIVGNDTDANLDALAISAVSGAVGGTVVLNGDGSVTFTPAAEFSGTAGFDYVVSDGNGGSDTGHATVTVAAVNDAAVITGTATGDVTETGGVASASGDLDSTDADGSADAWQAVAAGTASTGGYGSYQLSATGAWVYTLDNDNAAVQALGAGATLNDTFTALTADGTAQVVTVTIHGEDDAAVAADDAVSTDEATAIVGGNLFADNGSGADTDVDGPPPTIAQVNGQAGNVGSQIVLASGALLTVNADGTFDYDPNGAFDSTPTVGSGASNTPAQDQFTYTLADGASATVTITIAGLDSDDDLYGAPGPSTLSGGLGNDRYFVTDASDVVTEAAGQGNDRIFASVSYALAAGSHVERLTTSNNASVAAINLTGNELANAIYGNAGANVLNGHDGNDALAGLEGNDTLIGGLGSDAMNGGSGDDWYYVDNAGDGVTEGAAGGTLDRIFTSVSYALGSAVHVERLSTSNNAGTSAINLTGSELANQIYGNAGANVLDGKGGGDILVGSGGNDWYLVDNALDRVTEYAAEGTFDRVFASVSYALGSAVHVERLSTSNNAGTSAINLTGNELANQIYGNAGGNVLDGKAGNDTLVGLDGNDRLIGGLGSDLLSGGSGDDWYYVDNVGDTVSEGAADGAFDRVFAGASYTLGAGVHIERLSTDLIAGTAAIDLTGNELANQIYGNAGANVLDGKAGADVLVGLGGQDSFAFTTALGGGNVDTVNGFVAADDTIRLENAVFTGLAAGALAAGAFNTGPAATQADDRVIYNSATGALLFDVDGVGGAAAVQFATLSGGLALTSADFLVV
jgi:VCBS repeat-containing protein